MSKKERFLEESLKLIHEKGFRATTMRDIASKLNFEVANVYNYIDSKQALLEVYLFDISNEFHLAMDDIAASSYAADEKLRLVVNTHIQLTSKKPYELALLVNEWRNLKEPRLTEFLILRNNYESKLKNIVSEGIASGKFREMDVDLATNTILSTLRWLYDKYTQDEKTLNPIEVEKQLSDFIFAGIAKH